MNMIISDASPLIKLYYLILSKKWHTSEYSILKKIKISAMGKKHHILPKRCGISFAEVISNF